MPSIEYGDYPNEVNAEVFRPQGATDAGAVRAARKGRLLFDSGDTAAGAAIDTGTLDLSGVEGLFFKVNNADGAATRALTMQERLEDGTAVGNALTLHTTPISSTHRGAIAPGASNGTVLSWTVSATPPSKASFALAAGGGSNGRLTIWAR